MRITKRMACSIAALCALGTATLQSPAQSTGYSTSIGVNAQGVSTNFLGNAASYHIDQPSSVSYTKSDQSNGFTFTMQGKAAAQQGSLHSSVSFQLTPPPTCAGSCMPAVGTFGWGGNAAAHWTEYGVQFVGPQNLLSDVAGFEVTWSADGTFSGPAGSEAAYLAGTITQGGTEQPSVYDWLSGQPQQVSMFLQPANPDAPFTLDFDLYTQAVSNNPTVTSADADYYDTASFLSLVAVDGSGDVLPGVELQLSDGDLLGPSGLTPPGAATPEPPTWLLLGSGLLLSLLFFKRAHSF